MSETRATTLQGWKAIAAHFGRDRRTVMRWAEERDMPVRRLPGGGRSSIHALRSELDAWFASTPRPAEEAPPATTPIRMATEPRHAPGKRASHAGRPVALAAGVAVAVAIVGAAALRPQPAAPAVDFPRSARSPAAEQTFLQASYDMDLRTPDSLARAVREFGQAIAADPAAAPAYAGLGETYLLMREYAGLGEGEAFARAEAAASVAIRIEPKLAAAHRVLGFIAFWHRLDVPAARREFGEAIALDPLTRHWYATGSAAMASRRRRWRRWRRRGG